jgi:hypothetical protein
VDFAALLGKQLHFGLDHLKEENLFILVEDAITTLIEDLNELIRARQAEQVVDLIPTALKDETHVSFIEESLISEVSLADSLPDFLALAGSTEEGPRLVDQLAALVSRHVRQTREGLRDGA